MKKSQKLALEASEKRQRINELLALDELTDEQRAELDTLTKRMGEIEVETRAAITAEAEPEPTETEVRAEDRALREIRARVRIGSYVDAALSGQSVGGAEAEFNAALNLPANRFPLELLAPEVRATTDAEAAATQRTWVDRLFASTAAMRIGVTFQDVMPGVHAVPVTTAGATAAQRARQAAAADAPWTVGVTEIKPKRAAVRAVFTEEDSARLPGLEDALRRDLGMALTEGIDRAVFLGNASGGRDGSIVGLNTAGISEVELTQANKVKAPETLAVFAGQIDGIHAGSMGDLGVVVSPGANTLWLSQIAAAAADTKTLAAFFRENGLDWMVRGELAATTVANDFGAFIGRRRGIDGAGVAAVWNSAMLVRDPYSEAAEGKVALTLSTMWGFELPRPSNFARLKFVA